MSLTTRTLSSISNGISRQPAILRSPDQNEDEINTWGQIASGLGRRPPTEHIAALSGLDLSSATVHHINRDVTERYVVIITSGAIRVFDQATGVEKTVNAPDGWGYLDAPGTSYRAVTVADFTFIVNTEEVCALGAVGDDLVAQPAHYRWPGGLESSNVPGGAFQYPVNPTTGGAVAGTVQKFEDLPSGAVDGSVYEVIGTADTAFISFYVRKNGAVWDETVKPGLANALDATTMPHALVREADGTFTFAPFSWAPRRVGNEGTNPNPPFVGRTIRDVFFYQNRLGFLVDENVVFSAAGDYGDFWRRTILDYIDSDVVSVAATTTDVALLDYAVAFNDGMLLFSGQRQFSLAHGEAGLTATSVSIQPVTGYIMSRGVRPAPLGSMVYFASDAQGYTALQEYTRLDGEDSMDAAEVTAHVPRLLPKGVSQVIAAPDLDAVFVLVHGAAAAADRAKLYAYQFYWDAEEKIQSAWRVWDFGAGEPISGAYTDGALTLLLKRGAGYALERVNISPGAISEGQDRLIYLDRQVHIAGSYDALTDETTFTLPYEFDQDTVRLVRDNTATYPESLILPNRYGFPTATTITVPGDETGAPVTIGESYVTSFVFSQQYPLNGQGRPLTTGRLQIHTWTVNYEETAFFRAKVSPYGVDAVGAQDHVLDFTGRILGAGSFRVGEPTYHSGAFTFPVGGNSKHAKVTLENDTPYASTFVSAEWEGLFFHRAMG